MADAYVHIDTHEITELADDMKRHTSTVKADASVAVSRVGEAMKATAIALSPDLTGALDASMSLTVSGLGFDLGPTVRHGRYVELGTEGPYEIPDAFGWGVTVTHPPNAPEPYLGPAFDTHLPELEQALGDIAEGAVSRD